MSLYFFHNTEEVATPYSSDIFFVVPFFHEPAGEVDKFRWIVATYDAAIAVEISSYSNMFYSGKVYHMVKMFYRIKDIGFTVGTEETAVKTYLYHSAFARNGFYLFVS